MVFDAEGRRKQRTPIKHGLGWALKADPDFDKSNVS